MKRIFFTQNTKNYIDKLNKELLQKVASHEINYYAVSEEHSKMHRFYEEAVDKVVFPPVKVFALVKWADQDVKTNTFTQDNIYNIEVFFHYKELEERNLIVSVGDFIEFANQGLFFEIYKLTEHKMLWNMIEQEVFKKAECKSARKNQFSVLGNVFSSGSLPW